MWDLIIVSSQHMMGPPPLGAFWCVELSLGPVTGKNVATSQLQTRHSQ